MPELPEVETCRRGILSHVCQQTLQELTIHEARLRWPIPSNLPKLVRQQAVIDLTRRGKYLLFQFQHGCIILHLGMSGSLRIVPHTTPRQKHDHVEFIFQQYRLRYHDPRRFGAILWTAEPALQHSLLRDLGPEPLSKQFNANYLYRILRTRHASIKQVIMDSHSVVGVGNIYANEALFLAGIHPQRAACDLLKEECKTLVKTIQQILRKAIAEGGTTLRDFVGSDGRPGYFKQQLQVYGRGGEACLRCDSALQEIRLGQRSTVFCSVCQN